MVPSGLKMEHRFGASFLAIWGPLGGRFWADVGFILGSIWGSRARGAILAKTSTALAREHDFQGFAEPKKESKMVPKTTSNGNLAPRAS